MTLKGNNNQKSIKGVTFVTFVTFLMINYCKTRY